MPASGLGILYATVEAEGDATQIDRHYLLSHLRERYWIEKVGVPNPKSTLTTVNLNLGNDLGRSGVGRLRNEPGDGFKYHVRIGSSGIHSSTEWFEVTERFLTVRPKELTAFMRSVKGMQTSHDFDPDNFLASVNFGRPRKSEQKKAADIVIEAVETKLKKSSYSPMLRSHGYGTLIVGLPLWFATPPIDPLRPQNVIDDFMCRTQMGLEILGKRQLRDKECPFGRVIVVWETSWTAISQWMSRARLDVYDDPAHMSLRSPFKSTELLRIVMESWQDQERKNSDKVVPGQTLHVGYVQKTRRGRFVELPSLASELESFLARHKKEARENILVKVVNALRNLLLEILCFLKLHGIVGLERWVSAKLPMRQLALLAKRRRSRRLYRESLKRRNHSTTTH